MGETSDPHLVFPSLVSVAVLRGESSRIAATTLDAMLRLAAAVTRAAAVAVCVGLIPAGCATVDPAGPGRPTLRYAAADIVVTGATPPSLPVTIMDTIKRVPGIRTVTADRRFPLTRPDPSPGPDGPKRPWRGHGWASAALTPYLLTTGRPPQAPDEVATEASAGHIGDRIRLNTPSGTAPYTIVGTVRSRAATGERPVFFADERAAALSGTPDRIAAAAIGIQPGRDVSTVATQLRNALPDNNVRILTGDDRRLADEPTR
jgi:hypothetical protein